MSQDDTKPNEQADAADDKKEVDPFAGFKFENNAGETSVGSDKPKEESPKGDADASDDDATDDKGANSDDSASEDDAKDDKASEDDADDDADKDDKDAEKDGEKDADKDKDADKTAKKKESVKDRIAAITKKRREAERLAEAEAGRNSDLEKENAALKAKLGLTDKSDDAKGELKKPDAKDFEYGELDEKYIAARDKYLEESIIAKVRAETDQTRQDDAALQLAEENRELRDLQTETGVTKYEDYEAVVLEGVLNDLPPATPEAAQMILKSPNSADIMYHLAKNPVEAREMLEKPLIEQARYVGMLEAGFEAKSAEITEKPKPKPKAPAAQAPLTRTRGGDGKFSVSDDTDDFSAFESKHTRTG